MPSKEWHELYFLEQDLKKAKYKAAMIVGHDYLKEAIDKAHKEALAALEIIDEPIKCTCKCNLSDHNKHGCNTWYGDRNSGFGCDCLWRQSADAT